MNYRSSRTWASPDHLLEEWAEVSAMAPRPSAAGIHRRPAIGRLITAAAAMVVLAVVATTLLVRPLGVAGPPTPPSSHVAVGATPTTSADAPSGSFGPARPASWRLDPNAQIGPDSMSIPLLVTEIECASGQSPEGRILDPVIDYRADAVVISISMYTDPGDCPSNPEYPLTVELSEPLGDRVLLDGHVEPPTSPTPIVSPTPATSSTGALGAWRNLPKAPLEDGGNPAAVWTGTEFFVWGSAGLADGAAYDPVTDTWRSIAAGPPGPENMAAVWTGDVVLAWHGGKPAAPTDADGGIYDPATDSWSPISPGPLESAYGQGVAWSGSELLVLSPDMRAAAYDPAADRWRGLPSAPLAPGVVEADWIGSEWLVLGFGTDPSAAAEVTAFDPESGTWSQLAASPMTTVHEGRHGIWTGDDWLWLGWESLAYDRAADAWSAVDTGACPISTSSAVWTGSEVLGRGRAFDPETGACTDLPPAPQSDGLGENPAVAWTGMELLVWGGSSGPGDPTTTGGAAYNPSWPATEAPALPQLVARTLVDCSTYVAPPLKQDGVDVMETSLNEFYRVIEVRFFGEGDSEIVATVRYTDQACRDHPVLGPIIKHVLETAAETEAPLPTRRPGSD